MANAALQVKVLVEETLVSAKNQQGTDENQLIERQAVMYKTPPEKKTWRKATFVKYFGHKSYNITLEDGGTYCCTWQHLKPYMPKQPASCKGLPHSPVQQPQGYKAQKACVSHLTEWTCKLTDESKVNFGTVELC